MDGSGSKWNNSASLYVGYSRTGTLNIQNGGQVTNYDGYLGYSSGSSGTATVDGIESIWNNGGTLDVGGERGGKGSLTVKNGGQLTVGGTLKLWKADSAVIVRGGTLTAGALAGSEGTIRITNPVGGTALTVGSDASDTFSGTILDDTGPGSLTKVGSGTQTLGGVNTYTGATTIAAGTLNLASGATLASMTFDVRPGATFDVRALSGGFILAPGGTLKGSGTVLGYFLAGGVVAPGASPGILTVDTITFSSTGALQIELGGTARGTEYDVLAASGTVTLQSGSSLAVTLINSYVPAMDDRFDILDFAGLSGQFSTLSLPTLGSGLKWDASDLYTTGTITVAPEPATLGLVALGGLALLRRSRRK